MLRLVTKPLAIIFLTIFVNLVGFGIIIPLLPFYAETFGASPLTIGLLFASFSLSQLLASPILGDLSDRWGRRPVLIFSLLGTVVSFVMLALAHSLAMLFAARIVDGLSGGNITTARAYIADITTEENRAKAFGVLGAAFGLGFIAGPALGAPFCRIAHPRSARHSRESATRRRSGRPRRSPSWRRRWHFSGCLKRCIERMPPVVCHGARWATRGSFSIFGCSSPSTSSTGPRSLCIRRRLRCSARDDSG